MANLLLFAMLNQKSTRLGIPHVSRPHRDLVLEREATKILGFKSSKNSKIVSVFNEVNPEKYFSKKDRIMIRALYQDKIYSGMEFDEFLNKMNNHFGFYKVGKWAGY